MRRFLGFAVAGLLLFGTLYRLWPVAAGMPALWSFFITEDGYLLLTVARNMATGLGMTVSDGTIPTNGVQPMVTFLFTLPYLATGGDKVSSLIGIHILHTAFAVAALFAIRAFAARVLAPRDPGPAWPWAVAGLWFLAPLLLRHSMNGLETGLYTLVLVLTLLVLARVLEAGSAASFRNRAALGAMCGLAVLARNDAVFLVASIFAVWAAWELFAIRSGVAAMLARLVPPGLISIAVAAPWLINNQVRFGSIIPISGSAQSMAAGFGDNLPLLPAKLFEYVFPMLPVPSGLETREPATAVFAIAVALVLAIFLWRVLMRTGPVARAMVLAYAGHAVAISLYYGLWFGAAHFLSRYLAPLAPLLILAGLIAALEAGRWLRRTHILATLYAAGGLALSIALLARAALPGVTLEGHEQVVAWVQDNLEDETWAGAVQTGTLGYWHDRTINLDGKVNPEALAARRAEGHVLNYVTASHVDYIVDWAGVGDWLTFREAEDGFAEAFELILQDRDANLSVMRRRTP